MAETDNKPQGVLVMRTIAFPRDTNPNGDIFGGWILSQMDIGGALLAKEIAEGRVVTITVEKMTFVRPVQVGDAVCVYATPLRLGNSSVDIQLQVWAKGLAGEFQKDRHLVTTGVYRYVAIDDEGKSRPIPEASRAKYA